MEEFLIVPESKTAAQHCKELSLLQLYHRLGGARGKRREVLHIWHHPPQQLPSHKPVAWDTQRRAHWHPKDFSITASGSPKLLASVTQDVELHVGSRWDHLGASTTLWMHIPLQPLSQKCGSASAHTRL